MKIEQVFQLIIPVNFNIYNIRMKYRKKQTLLISWDLLLCKFSTVPVFAMTFSGGNGSEYRIRPAYLFLFHLWHLHEYTWRGKDLTFHVSEQGDRGWLTTGRYCMISSISRRNVFSFQCCRYRGGGHNIKYEKRGWG